MNSNFIKFTLFQIIHLVIGVPIFMYGITNVIEIIDINQKAQLERNRPKYILKEGFYGKMRHPMYSMIIIIQSSLFFSLCSALGILFSLCFLFFFMLLGLYEEKYQLIPAFREEYKEYIKTTKIRFLPVKSKIYLILNYLISIIGLIL